MRLSIIIPTRAFTGPLAIRLEAHRRLFPAAEIIVVQPADPEPGQPPPAAPTDHRLPDAPDAPDAPDERDESAGGDNKLGKRTRISAGDQTSAPAVQRLRALRGRGSQCNAGAARASGSLLLFLHDDTALPAEAPAVVENAFADPAISVACFRLRFDHPDWMLTTYAFFSRFESALTSFGDQGILVRRSFFAAIGGFPDWPLFEDVDLLSRARRRTRIKKLPVAVTTSAVRFLENGVLRQQLLNAGLMLRYSLGASPESLHRRYESRRT